MATVRQVIEGLEILVKYAANKDAHDFAAGHEQIYYGESDWSISEDDKKRLDELGWFIDEDSWSRFV